MRAFIVCLFVASVSSSVTFINNYAKSPEMLGSLETYNLVFMGDVESCETFKYQQYVGPSVVVRRPADMGRICTYNDGVFPEDSFRIHFDQIFYTPYEYGDTISLYKGSTFDVSLLYMNGNFGYSLMNLLGNLNLQHTQNHFFIVAINELSFNNLYDQTIFDTIMQSNQVLQVIVGENSAYSNNSKILKLADWPAINDLNVVVNDMDINITLHRAKNSSLESVVSSYIYNFVENKVCNYEKCYLECAGAPSNDSICISLPSALNATTTEAVRHLKFKHVAGSEGCPRFTRSIDVNFESQLFEILQRGNVQDGGLYCEPNESYTVNCQTCRCNEFGNGHIYCSGPKCSNRKTRFARDVESASMEKNPVSMETVSASVEKNPVFRFARHIKSPKSASVFEQNNSKSSSAAEENNPVSRFARQTQRFSLNDTLANFSCSPNEFIYVECNQCMCNANGDAPINCTTNMCPVESEIDRWFKSNELSRFTVAEIKAWYENYVASRDMSSIRRIRQTNDADSLPRWFLRYLIRHGLATSDNSIRNYDPSLYWRQIVSPSFSLISFNGTYIDKGCLPTIWPVAYDSFPLLRFRLYYQNGTNIRLNNLAKCYHVISMGQDDCLVYDIDLKQETMVRDTGENEIRSRKLVRDRVIYTFVNTAPVTTTTEATTTTTTEATTTTTTEATTTTTPAEE